MIIKKGILIAIAWFLPLCSQSFLSQEQIAEIEIQTIAWTEKHKDLSPSSKQLIGNVLYFSYKQAIYDEHVHRDFSALTKLMKKAKDTVSDYKNPKGVTALLARKIQHFYVSNESRYKAYTMWKHCITHIEKQCNKEVDLALQEIQKYGRQLIMKYSNTQRKEIGSSLKSTYSHLYEEQRKIQVAIHAMHGPTTQLQHADLQNGLILIDFALRMCNQAYASSWNIIDLANNIQTYQNTFLSISKELFFAYYKAWYQLIAQLDTQYQTTLFNTRGYLTDKDQMMLLEAPDQLILTTDYRVNYDSFSFQKKSD